MQGASIGAYRLTGVIGRGGMGAVYAAEHALLGRQAAIKVLLPDLSRNQDIVQRFFNEARAATAIRHPGIVEIYDFGWTADGAAFVVMEYLDGESLAECLARELRLPEQRILGIVSQAASALAAAHAKGIVHRDLKPENVFVVRDAEVPGGERIKLLDFGVAKLAGESAPAINVTRTGAVIGTPTYMAPEQCRGVAIDRRVDLYALGCVVFELCSGRPPFVGEGAGDVLAAHIHMPAPRLSAMQVESPYAVEQLVDRLLAKAPADRVQTAEDLIRAIDAIVVEPPVAAMVSSGGVRLAMAAPTHTTLSGAASTTQPSMRERRTVALVIATAAVIAVLVVALVTGRSRDAGPIAAQPAPSAPAPSAEPPPSRPASEPKAAVVGARVVEPAAPARPDDPPATTEAMAPEPARSDATSPVPGKAEVPAPPLRVAPAPPALVEVDVAIETTPPGATVELAGKLVGKTPFHGRLPRRDGSVPLIVRLEGYADKTLSVHADRAISARVDLVAAPRVPSRDRGVNPF